jgi:hypothetical protein
MLINTEMTPAAINPITIKTTSTNEKLGLYLTHAPQFGHVAAVVDTGCWIPRI